MIALIIVAVISALFAAYVVWGRPWMRNDPRFASFFHWIEPIEIVLWQKSETILKARAKMFVGAVLTALIQFQAIDITPILPIVPERYRSIVTTIYSLIPVLLIIGGWVDEKLRKDTTLPLEVVALPKNAPPEVKQAVTEAAAATANAVATVQAAKV